MQPGAGLCGVWRDKGVVAVWESDGISANVGLKGSPPISLSLRLAHARNYHHCRRHVASYNYNYLLVLRCDDGHDGTHLGNPSF